MIVLYFSKTRRDSSDMSISAEQGMTFAGWQRPYEALSHHYTDGSQEEHVEPTMLPVRTIDLVQDVAADCSVVASLCAAVARPQDGFNQVGNGCSSPPKFAH